MPTSPTSFRILLIEDNADTVDVISNFLKAHGREVVVAVTLKDAMRHTCNGEFGAVLCNITLPDGTGLIVPGLIKNTHPSTRMIALTEKGRSPEISELFAAGFDDQIVRPISFDSLLSRLVPALHADVHSQLA